MDSFQPPFTVHSGDEDPNNPGSGTMTTKHGEHNLLPDAESAAKSQPVGKFWEVKDANGKLVSHGQVAPPPPKGKVKTGRRSKTVRPTVRPIKKAKTRPMVKPKIKRPKRPS